MKAVIHSHTNFSYDSSINIDSILDFCVEYDVGLLILTDHDTVKGSIDAANKISEKDLSIICPPAAEYKTEFGDVILVGLPYDLISHSFEDLVKISSEKNCKLLFPHPFHDHTNIDFIASKVDFIEVFNSRCSPIENNKALELAKLTKKSTYASPDAHLLSEYKNCIVEYDVDDNSIWYEIMRHEWIYTTKVRTTFFNIYISALTKSIKKRSLVNFIKALIKVCYFYLFRKKDM